MAFLQLLVILGSFVTIWYGAGKIVTGADKFSRRLKVSSFAFSFLVLGLLTSTPEFGVGLTAISEGKPDIYIGNLIGGIPVLFLFAIPVLAILGNGLKFNKSINTHNLILSFAVMLLPPLFVIDGRITIVESLILILSYFVLLFFIQREKGLLESDNEELMERKSYSMKDILQIVYGVGLVFVASHYIVEGTIYFGQLLSLSTFFISLILLSIGTNLPELSLAVKSVVSGKKDVAFGDYIGSGAANTLLFGLFSLLGKGNVKVDDHFLPAFIALFLGLTLMFVFAKTKNVLSRKEAIVLIGFFLLFGLIQLM